MLKDLNPWNFALDEKSILQEINTRYPLLKASICKIDNVKLDNNGDGTILYKLQLNENEKLFFSKIVNNVCVNVDFSTANLFLNDSKVILTPFPFDPAIPWLKDATDPEKMKKAFNLYFSSLETINITPLAYTPYMRATIKYEISSKAKPPEILIGKTNLLKTPEKTYANYTALYIKGRNVINLPKPLFLLMENKTVFQEKIDGACLGSFLQSSKLPYIFKMIARQIAHFHKLDIPLSTIRKKEKDLTTLQKAVLQINENFPEIKQRVTILSEKIHEEIDRRHLVQAPIHADFHYSNIFVDKSKVIFLDFDEMALGDPSVDVGRFLASMRGPWLKVNKNLEDFYPLRNIFLETYHKINKKDINSSYLFEAANIFTSIASFIRFRHPDWKQECLILLDEAEAVFEKVDQPKKGTFQNKTFKLTPPWSKKEILMNLKFQSRLLWAQTEEYLKALLAPHIYNTLNIELSKCQKISQMDAKRYVKIDYRIKGYKQGEKVEKDVSIFLFNDKINKFLYNKLIPSSDAKKVMFLPEIFAVALSDNARN